ncbi:RNA ligase (ATP) [Massilia antarctica]|uniref:RNA ligase (ATP) n=1 Tax=Massilia antarctica TaxID=2765360 RepID=UPI0006BB9846|nr:RNA ligase (ATP) [Massilia sp. H27-R4]MCY0912784.1 RNA ligase (ATP) [Massilia sp. H27-R4]CUI03862.1 Phage protein [Janthinobacterium sp. CG23_2]CUU27648.1 Phage protein [Janthinobacterium sp. CG23_2]
MRKLATVRKVIDIAPIPGADAIECVTVDGWKVVSKKGEYQIGGNALYLEVDSWVPEVLAPFLCKDKREFNGVAGARLRTIKLRGQISQGLLLPAPDGANDGDDLTDALGIQKYEPPVPAELQGIVKGPFPSFVRKTNQERIQNLVDELEEWAGAGLEWEVSEKLDGSSLTAYLFQGEFGVCSRNLDLLETDGNSYWKAARDHKLEALLRASGRNLAVQGELIGPGVQGNPYGVGAPQLHVFDVYDIDSGRYLKPAERMAFLDGAGIRHCPVLDSQNLAGATVASLLGSAEAKSALNASTEREGLVFKCLGADVSFKAISNKFLLGEK